MPNSFHVNFRSPNFQFSQQLKTVNKTIIVHLRYPFVYNCRDFSNCFVVQIMGNDFKDILLRSFFAVLAAYCWGLSSALNIQIIVININLVLITVVECDCEIDG